MRGEIVPEVSPKVSACSLIGQKWFTWPFPLSRGMGWHSGQSRGRGHQEWPQSPDFQESEIGLFVEERWMSELIQVPLGRKMGVWTNSGKPPRVYCTLGTIPDNNRDQDTKKDGAQEASRWQSCAKTCIGGEAQTLLLNPSSAAHQMTPPPRTSVGPPAKCIWVSVLTL